MVEAGVAIINEQGWREAPVLLRKLEAVLEGDGGGADVDDAAAERSDNVRQGAVVFLGTPEIGCERLQWF